jgi:hypothetical protein
MNVIFRLNQAGCFDLWDQSDFDKGVFKFELRLKFKSAKHWDDFIGLMDIERERIEEKYGIHDSSGSGGDEHPMQIFEYDSYEIEDFRSCAKEWYDFFLKQGVIDND